MRQIQGKRLAIHVTRNGEYVGEMRREKRYDFNHQSLEGSSVKTLKRGDELTLTCSYDTSGQSGPTNFGDYTQDEMCLAYFLHYPAQKKRRSIFIRADGDTRMSLCMDQSEMPGGGFEGGGNMNPTALLALTINSQASWLYLCFKRPLKAFALEESH